MNHTAPNPMTVRYAPAAFLAALLHTAVVVVLVLFALAARNKPSVPEAWAPRSFVLCEFFAATPTRSAEPNLSVNIRPMPARPTVTEEPRPVVKNDPPVVQSGQQVKPKPGPRPAPAPPRNPTPTAKPSSRDVPPQTAPVRIDESWPSSSPSPSRSDIPSVDANAPQATTELAAYMEELRGRLKAALEASGMRPNLVAEVEFVLRADGMLLQPQIIISSGSAEFDRAVVQAINRTRMRARPDGKTVRLTFPFATELK